MVETSGEAKAPPGLTAAATLAVTLRRTGTVRRMSNDSIDIIPEAVYAAGTRVQDMTGSASNLAQRYLYCIDEVRAEVHHPTVQAALDRYRLAWHRPVYEVALEIESLGGNTRGAAVTVAQADLDATAILAGPATTVDGQVQHLSRDINTAV